MELIKESDGRLIVKIENMFFDVIIKKTLSTSIPDYDVEEQIIESIKTQLHDKYNSNN